LSIAPSSSAASLSNSTRVEVVGREKCEESRIAPRESVSQAASFREVDDNFCSAAGRRGRWGPEAARGFEDGLRQVLCIMKLPFMIHNGICGSYVIR